MATALGLLTAVLMTLPAGTEGAWKPLVPVTELSSAARINPTGVMVQARMIMRYRLVPPSSLLRKTRLGNSVFDPTSVGVMSIVDVNPAFSRVGVGVEVTPAAVWRMRLSYQAIQYFGLFANLMEYPSPKSNWSPSVAKRRNRSGCCHGPDTGHRLLFENLFQLKLYRVVALSLFTVELWRVAREGTFYSGDYDLLVQSPDAILKHIGALAVVLTGGPNLPELAVGGFHAVARSIRAQSQNQQAGMLLMYSPVNDRFLLYRTGLTALIGFHLQDRYKQTSPYGVLLLNVSVM